MTNFKKTLVNPPAKDSRNPKTELGFSRQNPNRTKSDYYCYPIKGDPDKSDRKRIGATCDPKLLDTNKEGR